AVSTLVIAMEGFFDNGDIVQAGDRNFYIMTLPAIAHFDMPLIEYFLCAELLLKRAAGVFLHDCEGLVRRCDQVGSKQACEGGRPVEASVSEHHADCREVSRFGRNDDGWDRQLARQGGTVKRSAA